MFTGAALIAPGFAASAATDLGRIPHDESYDFHRLLNSPLTAEWRKAV